MSIKATNLKKKYGSKYAVKDISLEIPKAKTIGLLGPNGSGKTTTIKMLTGQISPTSGSVEYDGISVKKLGNEINEKIGIMPQEVVVWDHLTIAENLDFSGKLYNLKKDFLEKRKTMLIKKLKLEPELKTLARNLSGGYRRRLNLAISIIHNPETIFLDEPTPGVDPQSRRAMWDFIYEIRESEKHSILLTDHYLDEAEKVCDYIIIIDHGEIIAQGTFNELKKKYAPGQLLKIELKDDMTKKFKEVIGKEFKKIVFEKNTLALNSNTPERDIPKILKILNERNLEFSDISLKDSSLEDIFLLLTGREIR